MTRPAPSVPPSSTSPRWFALAVVFVLAALAYRTPLQALGRWHNTDESLYAAGVAFQTESDVALRETLPIAGNRPLHYAIFWLCDRLFGHYPGMALDVAHSLVIAGSAGLLAVAAWQLLGLDQRYLAAIGVAFILHSYPFNQGLTNNSEHLANLLRLAFLTLWLAGVAPDRRLLRMLAFLALGLAVSVKRQQLPLIFCAPLFWWVAPLAPKKPSEFAKEMAGAALFFLLPHLVFMALFRQPLGGASDHALKYFLDTGFGVGRTLFVFGYYILQDPVALVAFLIAAHVVAHPLLTRLGRERRRALQGSVEPTSRVAPEGTWQIHLATVFFVLSVLSLLPGLRLWRHYFLLLAPAGFLLIVVALHNVSSVVSIRPRHLMVTLAALLFLQNEQIVQSLRKRDDDPEFRTLVGAITSRSQPADRIFVWGWMPEIYSFSHRVPASRYVFCQFIVNDQQIPSDHPDFDAERVEVLLRDLDDYPPELFIVVKNNPYTLDPGRYELSRVPRVQKYLADHFAPQAEVETESYAVYRRKLRG